MELLFSKHLVRTVRNLYRSSGFESAFNKARLHNAKRESKAIPEVKANVTDVFISYTALNDAEVYKDLIEKKMLHVPITFSNIAFFRKAYPPPTTIKFVGFSTDGNTPLEVVRLMVTGIKYLHFTIE